MPGIRQKPEIPPVSEILRVACICAERDLEALVDAYSGSPDDPEAVAAASWAKYIRDYRLRRWGRTRLEAVLSEAEPMSIAEVARRAETEGHVKTA